VSGAALGYVAGADLTTGKTFYRHVNGTVRDLSPIPLPFKMGVPGIGGPMITRGDVAFLSGTLDNFARACGVTSGKQLWEDRLPGGQATPMTYWSEASRRQLVVVVAVAMARRMLKRATRSLPMHCPNHDGVHTLPKHSHVTRGHRHFVPPANDRFAPKPDIPSGRHTSRYIEAW
jgi:hypothetical protein